MRDDGAGSVTAGPDTHSGAEREQRRRFERLGGEFADRLTELRAFERAQPTREDWAQRNRELGAHLVPRPPWDFLRHPAIRFQMFVDRRYAAGELPYVARGLPDPRLLREDPVGDPPHCFKSAAGVWTSSNTVHQLHHLLRFQSATRRTIAGARTVVEWGAGYGSLAKLLLRLHGGTPTCVLIDTPVFSAVQWLYLSTVLGEGRVVLHLRPGGAIAGGRVNIVPAAFAGELDVRADLFVSTWALNESPPEAQRLVLERDFFGADALLLGMHDGDPLAAKLVARGARPVPVGDFMPSQYYFVR